MEVDRMKSEFIATVSHELRTPITSINGALGLVLGGATGPVPEAQEDLLKIARTNADRLIRLVNDVLDLSRVDAGRLDLRRETTDLNGAVKLAVQELDGVRRRRGLNVHLSLEPSLPPINADPHRIGQVMINLVGNAYKFSDQGASIRVQTSQINGHLQVQVIDDGPGIPEGHLESIFDRFHRAPGKASDKAGGTGLGLAIARSIIEEHDGRIWAESQPGQGATFSFSLPIRTKG
jgi:signal transduction histidine kinase